MNESQETGRSPRKNPYVDPCAGPQAMPQGAVERARFEDYKQHAIGLLKQGEFNEAARRLEKLANVEGPGAQPYAQWAKAELARVQAMPTEVREKGPSLVAEAINLLAQQDYASAVALLQYVPAEYRSAEAGLVWKRALELKNEADRLNERMTQAVRDRQYDGLREKVLERLLEIQPGNLTARDIYEHLGTYGPGQKLRFDKTGNLLPAHSGHWWVDKLARLVYERLTRRQYRTRRRKGPGGTYLPTSADDIARDLPLVPGAIGLGILGVAGLLVLIVFLFRQGLEPVRVELDPALANDASVTVWLDGKPLQIAGVGDETISLKPGEHGYEIRRGDEVLKTDEFTVLKDNETVLRISVDRPPDTELAQTRARDSVTPATADHSSASKDAEDDATASKDASKPSAAAALEEDGMALFNGRDLEGWQPVPRASSGDWVVEDGAIACRSDKSPILWTDKPYGNFHLKLEFKLDANADGGIYLRSHSRESGAYMGAMEISVRGDESTAGGDSTSRNGGLFQLVAPTGNAFRPGQWNGIEIRADSSDLTVMLNGEEVVRTNLENQRAEKPEKEFLSNAVGYIGLQCFGGSGFAGTVRYRNIRIHELGVQPDFNSEPLEVRRFEGHDLFSFRVAVSPDGRLVASSPSLLFDQKTNRRHPVRVWDLASGNQTSQLDAQNAQMRFARSLDFAPDNKTLCCVSDTSVLRWDFRSDKVIRFELPEPISASALSDDGQVIAYAAPVAKRMGVIDATTGREVHRFDETARNVMQIVFVPGSHRFLTVGIGDRAPRLWDPNGDTATDLPEDHKDGIQAVAVSPDAGKALSGGGFSGEAQDYSIRYWDLPSRRVIRKLDGHTGRVAWICFSPNGRYALSTGQPGRAILWDLSTGEDVCRMSVALGVVRFADDGQHALLPHWDHTIGLWRLPLRATSSEKGSPPVAQETTATPPAESSAASTAPRIVVVAFPDGQPGTTVKNSLGMELLFIPSGSFMMGTPPSDPLGEPLERPQHRVTLTRPFYMGRYEVTQGEFRNVMGRNPSRSKPGPGEDADRLPADSVSWYDAIDFCNKLSAREGRTPWYGLANVRAARDGRIWAAEVTLRQGNGYRLPTEAEWEFACRTGISGVRWYFGNDPSQAASFGWFKENAEGRTHPVGQKKPNAVGLYDLLGNVWEHCADSGGSETPGYRYTTRPRTDPLISGSGDSRIQRGGSFHWGPARCGQRGCNYPPTTNFDDFGFRIVSDLHKPDSARGFEQTELPYRNRKGQ